MTLHRTRIYRICACVTSSYNDEHCYVTDDGPFTVGNNLPVNPGAHCRLSPATHLNKMNG